MGVHGAIGMHVKRAWAFAGRSRGYTYYLRSSAELLERNQLAYFPMSHMVNRRAMYRAEGTPGLNLVPC